VVLTEPHPSLERFFALSPHPLCVVTVDGRLAKVNAAWSNAFGGSGADPTAKPLADFIHEVDRERVRSTLAKLFPGPATATFECRTESADGSILWLSWSAMTPEGEELAYCVIENITQPKTARRATLFNEDIYHQILDALADMVLIKGPESRLLWANRAFREFYGMTNEELRGIIDAPFNTPDYTLQYVKDDRRVFESGEPLFIAEEPVTRHDKQVRIFRTNKSALRDAEGKVIATVGVSIDITEAKRREEGLQRFEHAIAAASEGIWVADATRPDVPIVYVNSAAERLSGHARAELLGIPLQRVIDSLTDAAAAAALSRAIESPRELSVDVQRPKGDGASSWIRIALTPVRSDSGGVVSFIAVQSDITTERDKQAQAAAIAEQRHLIERQRETIAAMATPIIEIWNGVLTMPLIGVVDSRRAADLMESLLHAIAQKGARYTVVDLTGVEVMDTSTADHLLKLVQAARLLGSTCVLSGISPAVSTTMVSLGVQIGGLRVFGTLRAALGYILGELGIALVGSR
jgi:PAS domain S-box-containing protein